MTADRAREEAGRITETTGDQARQVRDRVAEEAGSLAGEARERARHVAGDAGRRLREELDEQVGRAAGGMRDMGRQLRTMSDAAPEEQSGGAAVRFAGDAARWMDETAGRLETEGLEGLMRDVERLARRRPVIFLAGAAGLGLMAGRMITTARSEHGNGGRQGTIDRRPEPAAGTAPGRTDLGYEEVPPASTPQQTLPAGGGAWQEGRGT